MADEKRQSWSKEEWQEWWNNWNEPWQPEWEEWQHYAGEVKDEPHDAGVNDAVLVEPAAKRRKVVLPQGPLAKQASQAAGGNPKSFVWQWWWCNTSCWFSCSLLNV